MPRKVVRFKGRLGQNIKKIRLENALTQKELGDMMSVTHAYISMIENSRKIPTEMFVKLFCSLFSIDIKTLKE